MDEQLDINIEIAGKKYSLPIKRNEEELIRAAVSQINKQMLRYNLKYASSGLDTKDLLAMVTLQLSIENLQLEKRNDTSPFTEKIQQLTTELEVCLRNKEYL